MQRAVTARTALEKGRQSQHFSMFTRPYAFANAGCDLFATLTCAPITSRTKSYLVPLKKCGQFSSEKIWGPQWQGCAGRGYHPNSTIVGRHLRIVRECSCLLAQ